MMFDVRTHISNSSFREFEKVHKDRKIESNRFFSMNSVPLSKRPKHQLRGKNRIYFNNSIRSKKQRSHVGRRPYKFSKQTGNQCKQN